MTDPADPNPNPVVNEPANNEPAAPSEPVRDPEAVLQKNAQLLGEIKKLKESIGALRSEKDSLVQEKMNAEGNKDEQIKYWQTKAEEANDTNKKVVGNFLDRTIKAAFNNAALSKGCKQKYLNVLYNQAKSDNDTWNKVIGSVNKENFEVDSAMMSDVVESFKTQFDDSGFFNRPNQKVDDETPPSGNYVPAANNGSKSEDELLKDLEKYYS